MRCKCAWCGSTTTQSRKKANNSDRVFCDRKCKNRYQAGDDRTKCERWNYLIAVMISKGKISSNELRKEYFPQISKETVLKHLRTFRDKGLIKYDEELSTENGKSVYRLSNYLSGRFEIRNED